MKQLEPSTEIVSDSVELLRALDPSKLRDHERQNLVAPGRDGRLYPIAELFYNDLGPRACHFQLPPNRIQVHDAVEWADLCPKLRVVSLGSLHLTPMNLDSEDMCEDLTTRIQSVLRAYNKYQEFGEFLANAADAGATRFGIILDNDLFRRQASVDDVVCKTIAQCCTGPALVIYNDAEFTRDDINGICRVGRGGKESRDATIGRFGLGSLSFYHFSEVGLLEVSPHLNCGLSYNTRWR